MVDPLSRYAMLYEAEGDAGKAARYYRRAADFCATHEGFDQELVDEFLDRARQLEDRLQAEPNPRPANRRQMTAKGDWTSLLKIYVRPPMMTLKKRVRPNT